MNRILILSIVFCGSLVAQPLDLPRFAELAKKASETVEVTLDGNMLQMASRFLSEKKKDEAQAKQLLTDLKGIYVRSLKFEKEGEYTLADVEQIRSQLRSPEWSKVVDVRSAKGGGDNAGVYLRTDGKEITGLVVLAAEPKELTVVQIVGPLDPERLRDLGGNFGIPRIDLGKEKKE
jgi:hypothetical protein